MAKFTARLITNLKPKKHRYEIWEGNGFGIRVSPAGKKSWVYVYHYQNRSRRMTLGDYPKMSLAEAHIAHAKAVEALRMGNDPGIKRVSENQLDRLAPTVEQLITEYIEKWAKPRKRSWKEDQRMLLKDIQPTWGKRKAKEIKRREVILLLDKISGRGSPIAANRTLAVLRRMFNFAIERDILETSPCFLVKAPSKENRKERFFSEEEIKDFWHGLDSANMSELTKLALKFQLTTAQRKGEIISAEWNEFDLKKGWWTIPGTKTKNGKTHLVPLSPLAESLLKEIKKLSDNSQWLFPSPKEGQHISGPALDKAVRRNQNCLKSAKQATPHDLRRTAASHMTALGIPRLVVAKILNHSDKGVTSIYDRHSYDTEKLDALKLWGQKLSKICRK